PYYPLHFTDLTSLSSRFSFQCSRPHRYPHPFPTRRSSDLRDLTTSVTAGIRVEPPTSTTWSMSETEMPASLMTWWKGAKDAGISDRKSTRLNSSHVSISYAVFCLKKKQKPQANKL